MNKQEMKTYLEKNNFSKRLKYLNKITDNKKIVIYGSGLFFQTIYENYDLSKLNIIGLSDKKFLFNKYDEDVLGYKCYSIHEVEDLKPDFILVCILDPLNVIYDLKNVIFKDKNITILPMVKKSFWGLIKEVYKL